MLRLGCFAGAPSAARCCAGPLLGSGELGGAVALSPEWQVSAGVGTCGSLFSHRQAEQRSDRPAWLTSDRQCHMGWFAPSSSAGPCSLSSGAGRCAVAGLLPAADQRARWCPQDVSFFAVDGSTLH